MKNFELLEGRTLLSGNTSGQVLAGEAITISEFVAVHVDAKDPTILVVEGTHKSDEISIGRKGDKLVVTNGSKSPLAVAVVLIEKDSSGRDIYRYDGATSYPISRFSKVIVNGANGNDLITISDKLSIPVEMNGGNGNDTLSGGSGNDTLLGGKGNDSLIGNLGDDEIHGNIGDDSVNGGRGLNQVFGDAGTDSRPKKGPGFDYRIDSIETNPYTGQASLSVEDLQKYFDGVSVVKLDDGRLVAEVGFTSGNLPIALSMTQPKNRLGQFEINVTGTVYRRITGGTFVLTPTTATAWQRANGNVSVGSFFYDFANLGTRRVFDLGKLGSGDYSVTVKSGDATLGEYRFANTNAFKGQRVDATNYLKYNSKLPSIEDLLKSGGSGLTIISTVDGGNVYVNYASGASEIFVRSIQ